MQETTCSAGDPGFILGLGRSPGEGSGNPLQYAYLGNTMDRRAWRTVVHGVAGVEHDLATELPTTYTHTHIHTCILESCEHLDWKSLLNNVQLFH